MKYKIEQVNTLSGKIYYLAAVRYYFWFIPLWGYLTRWGDTVDDIIYRDKFTLRQDALHAIDTNFKKYQEENIKSIEIEYVIKS